MEAGSLNAAPMARGEFAGWAGGRPLDLGAPWWQAWRDRLTQLLALPAQQQRTRLTQWARELAVRNASGQPIVFAPPDDAGSHPYEAHIAATGRVPTRALTSDSAHDLLNALVWLRLPRLKAALNARQAEELARDGVRAVRGAARDAATLIDENGLLLACEDRAVFEALAARDWTWLFVGQRARWHATIVPQVVGHALLDKLAAPYKAITAHAVTLAGRFADDAALDAAAAHCVAQAELAPRLLLPLPVLGIPGWCSANDTPSFYDDPAVFRPLWHAA
jgi:hypothetical protein